MKTIGIIAEYNPFHNGHFYQINKAKQITGADYVIVVMSGNYVQRGIPSIISKYNRTQMCLDNGIDLVLELPVCYSCASAEYFAKGAVALLDKLNIVDYLCFGSECDNITFLKLIASLLVNEPLSYQNILQGYLKQGLSYPTSRAKALIEYCMQNDLIVQNNANEYEEILSSPNNILAIEYLKALLTRNSPLIPIAIKRIGSDYNDQRISESFSSATAIRKCLLTDYNDSILKANLPEKSFQNISSNFNKLCPIEENDFSIVLGYKILFYNSEMLAQYFDVSKEFANRIENNRYHFINYNQFSLLLKSKEITYSRITRSLLHIILEIKQADINQYIVDDYIPYIRVLGFKKASSILLTKLKEETKLPVICKMADANKKLSTTGQLMLTNNLYADHLYRSITMNKFNTIVSNEYTQGLVIR